MKLSSDFFKRNRQTLTQGSEHGLVVVTANNSMQRSNDQAFGFKQDADFLYLSGIEDPDWVLVTDNVVGKSWLVAPYIDEMHRIFEGGISADDAKILSGVDTIITHNELEALLRQMAKKHSIVYTIGNHPHREHFNFIENPAQKQLWLMLERIFNSVKDCRSSLAKQRAIKQTEELVLMKEAIKLTCKTFETVHQKINEYTFEYEIEADFDYHFKFKGASHAYDPIIASGINACTLHYISNDSKLRKKSLVLLDVGSSVSGYASDVTRTYVHGEANKRQKQVHNAVEQAHLQIIDLLEPYLTVENYQRSVDTIMADALKSLGLYKDDSSLRRYFPHAVSHGLGLDVHDSLGAPKHFVENMVLTVEPGIYIPEESIGVRIEDDIQITKNGRRNLSGSLSTGL